MGDEAGRMTAEPCAGCGCKWKRCRPDTPGSDTGVVVCAYCGTFQSRYEFTDLPAAPVGGDEGQTDLPDAETPRCMHADLWDVVAACGCKIVPAASGPWAEQLDAANAERDEQREIAEWNDWACKKNQELFRQAEAERDAALARNAELQEQRDAEQEMHAQDCAENSRLRAELDNLRGRVTALADDLTNQGAAAELPQDFARLRVAERLRAIVPGGCPMSDMVSVPAEKITALAVEMETATEYGTMPGVRMQVRREWAARLRELIPTDVASDELRELLSAPSPAATMSNELLRCDWCKHPAIFHGPTGCDWEVRRNYYDPRGRSVCSCTHYQRGVAR